MSRNVPVKLSGIRIALLTTFLMLSILHHTLGQTGSNPSGHCTLDTVIRTCLIPGVVSNPRIYGPDISCIDDVNIPVTLTFVASVTITGGLYEKRTTYTDCPDEVTTKHSQFTNSYSWSITGQYDSLQLIGNTAIITTTTPDNYGATCTIHTWDVLQVCSVEPSPVTVHTNAILQHLSVTTGEYLGIDLTDAGVADSMQGSAAHAQHQPTDTYTWTLVSPAGAVFDPVPDPDDVQVTIFETGTPSSSYREEILRVEAGTCSSVETNFTIVEVDISMGASEDDEEVLGANVVLNKNDNDDSDVMDKDESPVSGEGDLVAVQFNLEPDDLPTTQTVSIDGGVLFEEMDKSVPAESEYAVTEFPLTLYAEGDSAGSTHIITASHDESGAKDKVKYTVIEVDLSGPHQFEDDPSIENELEEFKEGSYVVLNDDDQSSENQEWDLNDPIIEKVNDDRVLGLDLTATPGDLSEDKVTLDWSPTSKLNVYKIDTGGTYTEVSPGEELDSDSLPTLKIEGVEASDSMKDIVMTASYTRESDGSASGTAEDEIRLTVVSVDVDGDSNRDGAVDDDDDKMEMDDTQGVLVWVNDDDSNADGTIDNSNTAIDGPADATQMTDITVRKVLPDDIPAGTVLLSGADNVRIFKSDGTMVKPASGDSGAAVDLWSDLPVTLKAEGVTSGQSELTVTYSFTKADGGVVTFTDKMQVTVIKVELTGHRPTNEGPAYGDPFQRHEIPDDEEETPGVGIRVNGDTEPAADENDLIEVIIDVEPFPIPSGVESFLRRSNDDITVWDSQTMGTALLDSGTEAAVTINTSPMSIWVENPDGGDADLDLVAKDGSGNDVALDKLHFFPFTSVVVVFEGENGVPADPPVTGVSQLALDIYESGYDVHLFEEPDLGDDPMQKTRHLMK